MGVDLEMAARNAKDGFKEFYSKLLEVLPISLLISQFYTKALLSDDHKNKLDTLTSSKERAEYFLDRVIKPGLQIDFTKQFDEMLLIMQNSDDPPVKYLADEVMKFMGGKPEATLGMLWQCVFTHVLYCHTTDEPPKIGPSSLCCHG